MPLISTYSSMSHRGWSNSNQIPIPNEWLQQQKLIASDGQSRDIFGLKVALNSSGNIAIIGAPGDDIGTNTDQGSAYVFTYNGITWTQQQKLTASDGQLGDAFGSSVTLNSSGNIAIIGTGYGRNSVYIFTYNGSTWTQQQKITGNVLEFSGNISAAFNQSGNTIIIGSSEASYNSGISTGCAYIYIYNGSIWTQQQLLTASDGAAGDNFGQSVAINSIGNIALIGASNDSLANANVGSAYIFTYNGSTWTQQQKITGSTEFASKFGEQVAINSTGNIAIIGARQDDIGANIDQGSAYIFTYNGTTWTQQQKLISIDGANGDNFGSSVSLNSFGNIAIIGAYADNIGTNTDQGSAYVFAYNGSIWIQQQKLTANDGGAYDYFGASVSSNASGNVLLIGARQDTPNNGAAYIFNGN